MEVAPASIAARTTCARQSPQMVSMLLSMQKILLEANLCKDVGIWLWFQSLLERRTAW